MDAHLRAGIAIYNDGHYHAAHDAWEDYWLDLESGEDRDFLQGLIQFTAAVYHTTEENWTGAASLAESARAYLDGLGETYRGVDLGPVRSYLSALESDAGSTGQSDPPTVSYEGSVLDLADLGFEATAVAAPILAEELGYDEAVIEQGVAYARADIDDGSESTPFVTLTFDFVRDPVHRGIVAQRLGEHVQRRQRRESDVDGLF